MASSLSRLEDLIISLTCGSKFTPTIGCLQPSLANWSRVVPSVRQQNPIDSEREIEGTAVPWIRAAASDQIAGWERPRSERPCV